jgi:2-iminobutanoate/2-iminopropanoate deaminase
MKKVSLLISSIAGLLIASAASAKSPPTVEFLNSGKVMPTTLPFSEAVRVDNLLFLSGMVGVEPGALKLVPGGMKEESKQIMSNIKTILETHGYTMRDLVKCTVMLADMSKWGEFNEVYKTFFDGRYPARSALGANGLALGAQVEVECIAAGSGK